MRLRITLVSVTIVIISAIGFTSFASAVPVKDTVASAANLKAPKPPKGCPYMVRYWEFRGWVGDLSTARGKIEIVSHTPTYLENRFLASAKRGFVLCRTVIQYGKNKQYVSRSNKVDKVIRLMYDKYTGKLIGLKGFYIFAKKK